jgi:hypothetical protein
MHTGQNAKLFVDAYFVSRCLLAHNRIELDALRRASANLAVLDGADDIGFVETSRVRMI